MTIRGKVISFQVFRFDATAPSTLIGEHDAAMVPSADRACGRIGNPTARWGVAKW
jgi:hypothetical protein